MSPLRMLHSLVLALTFVVAVPAKAADLTWLDDRAAVQQFVDGVLAAQIASGDVVGATVSIVRGGDVVLAKGYGLADMATDRSVDGAQTLFRIGSVSKVFVWVAVMQQVAAGRLDLNADVNTYLKDLQIAPTYPQPITLTHLMTHTPGFEDKLLGLFARGPLTVGDFHSNLLVMMPRRVMMPGHFGAYSNYGAALAGHLVEIVSAQDWDTYVDGHILKPLGMSSTTTRQPVPPALAEQVASGYVRESGRVTKAPFEFVTIPPAASVSSTAADMGRFMIELLTHGDTAVLTSRARSQLFTLGYQHDPRLNRMLYGLYEQNSHGQQLVGHDGETLAFHTILLLCPALDLGIFASYNSEGGERARKALIDALLDRLFGRANVHLDAVGSSDAERYIGYYTSLRAPSSGHDRIQSLLQTVRVSVDDEGRLLLTGTDARRPFVKIDDDLFQDAAGPERLAFRVEGGRATHLFLDSDPRIEFVRVAARDEPLLQIGVPIAVLVLGIASWLFWPLSWWRNRGRVGLRGETRATLLAVFNVALIIGFVVVIGAALVQPRELVFGLPKTFADAMWLPIALVPLILLQLVYTSRAWISGFWWMSRRIHYTLLTFASIGFIVWTFYWHLTAVIIDF